MTADRGRPTISVSHVSKWYGNVVAISDVSFGVFPGITGLLGPNGAGKTTLLRMMAGLSRVSEGEISVLDEPVRTNPQIYRRVGVMPEHDALYPFYTGREFVELSARLHGLPDVAGAASRAIDVVNLGDAQGRKVGGYSRGMRQRIRLAASLVHDPEVLLLDEPLNGTDPRQRIEFHSLLQRLSDEGYTILISSHILEEVETLAGSILLMVSGKLAAAGDFHAIREKLDERPYKVLIECDRPRDAGRRAGCARRGRVRRLRAWRHAGGPEQERGGVATHGAAVGAERAGAPYAPGAAGRFAGERVRLPGGGVTWARCFGCPCARWRAGGG